MGNPTTGQKGHASKVVVVVAFSSLARIWGGKFDYPFPACVFFVVVFFKVEIRLRALIPLFMPGSVHCGSAS